jgi:hypothetical protein
VFPINFVIAFLFKKSRPRYKRPSRITEALKKMKEQQQQSYAAGCTEQHFINKDKPIVSNHWEAGGYLGPLGPSDNLNCDTDSTMLQLNNRKKKFSLPWWCIIVAWILLWLTVAGAVAGVTFYGIMFQAS